MDWVIGLYLFATIATLATAGCFVIRIDYIAQWCKYDITSIVLWFKTIATVFWLTFFGLLGIYFLIGE